MKRWINRINGLGARSVMGIENLTILKESVIFAHMLLLHWSNIYHKKFSNSHLTIILTENGLRINLARIFCLNLIRFSKEKDTLKTAIFVIFRVFQRSFGSSNIFKNRLLNAISAQIQKNSSESVIYKGASSHRMAPFSWIAWVVFLIIPYSYNQGI